MLRRCLLVVSAALVLQAVPSLATSPGPVTPLLRSTLLTAADTVVGLAHERLVGVTWDRGAAVVRLRWHTAQGWGVWQTAEQDGSDEGRPGTEPQWRPAGADRVEVKAQAPGLKLVRVTDGPLRRVLGSVAHAATGRAVLGSIRSRADWGADESMRSRSVEYASRVVAVTVHHTDNGNGYGPADVPAIIRADYAYHVNGRGWDDLGYNLLVDEFGQIWEGRHGGLGRATVGAHAQGFNNGTLGVAMIGDMTKTTASPEAERALAKVVAYAATTWHFDPTTTVSLRSKGSPRYASGRIVTLPRVFGHGQTGITDCPGSLQGRLASIALASKRAGAAAPRILSTTVEGAPVHAPDPATITGRLSDAVGWGLALRDDQGKVVATAKGTGAAPRLSWDGTRDGLPMLPGSVLTWKLVVDDGFHDPVVKTGTFSVGLPGLAVL